MAVGGGGCFFPSGDRWTTSAFFPREEILAQGAGRAAIRAEVTENGGARLNTRLVGFFSARFRARKCLHCFVTVIVCAVCVPIASRADLIGKILLREFTIRFFHLSFTIPPLSPFSSFASQRQATDGTCYLVRKAVADPLLMRQ